VAEIIDAPQMSRSLPVLVAACGRKPIRDGGDPMSHPELADRAAAVAAALAELDVHPDDRVLIMLPDSPGFVEAFVGVTQRGAVPLSVNPRLAVADVAAIAAETGARLVLTSAKRIRRLADLDAEPPVLVDGLRALWAATLRLR
jgi:long-chain acyl-CoA synthetase